MSRRPLLDLPRPRPARMRHDPLLTRLHAALDDVAGRSRPHARAFKLLLAHAQAELHARDAKKRA